MKLSLNWLKDFVDIPTSVSPQDLALDLTLKVVEVSHVHDLASDFTGIMVGKIVSVRKHPNADQLQLCTVDVGKKTLPVVCGGSNVREGMVAALAMVGAKVRWHGEGNLVELKTTKIRGEISKGMICASDEIGLADMFPKKEEKEIIDLSEKLEIGNWKLGTPLAKALGLDDVIIEIDNSSLNHRPDLWGHYGMAREIAALYGKNIKPYPAYHSRLPKKTSALLVSVQDKKLCRAYSGVLMEGINIGPSPLWLQQRLLAAGQRPINNIVDITNYVMLELGQPTHAFDIDQLTKNNIKSQLNRDHVTLRKEQRTNIVVRLARDGEKMKTLDGVERKLTNDMLVIADSEKPVAIAGVMGGEGTEVTENTSRIWFESANFDPVSVRQTSKALGLRTEGSMRWEKNQDPENALVGLRRLIKLTQQIIPSAKMKGGIFSELYWRPNVKPIILPLSFVEQKIGTAIKKQDAINTLKRLCFGVKTQETRNKSQDPRNKKQISRPNADVLEVTVPSWRATKDISIKEDMIEEIVRFHGYNNINTSLPRFPIQPSQNNRIRDIQKIIRDILAYECGYTEVYNYSFESKEWLQKLGEDISQYIELENPLAKDRPLVRRHLIPGLLEIMEKNLYRFPRVKVFEVGRVFHKEAEGDFTDDKKKNRLPAQPTQLGIAYAAKEDEVPFFEVSGAISRVFERLGVSYRFNKQGKIYSDMVHPGRFAEIIVGETVVGRITELHPMMQEKLGVPYRVAILQITLDDLAPLLKETTRYEPLSLYPPVERDVAFVVDAKVEHSAIEKHMRAVSDIIASVELFDVFSSNTIGKNKKSMAYHVVYRSKDKTLETKEVDTIHDRLITMLKQKFGAQIRE